MCPYVRSSFCPNVPLCLTCPYVSNVLMLDIAYVPMSDPKRLLSSRHFVRPLAQKLMKWGGTTIPPPSPIVIKFSALHLFPFDFRTILILLMEFLRTPLCALIFH